ncbi:carboxylate--amine ligase [Vagococcus xieshaowenii]|uniref:Carboxylate--amine ligase n=1 Tax=Vagococcus xieshaowenii TaxID=2562451 RepID=A0AAJ5EDQ4_9ENTE|nr:carboxylate--amine ligase [Vagococcus xieshaowenii]TFZ40495.1 carboxylate--amine ligase [Vagococcus xieshaowenii]
MDKSAIVEKFTVILLGSDINVYGMARAFHEEYGIVSEAHSLMHLSPTKYSHIVNVHAHDKFDEPEGFIKAMREVKKHYANNGKVNLLIPCGDGYTELIAMNKAELEETFICPTIDTDLQKQLEDKVTFYETCEEYGLPYPATYIINKDIVANKAVNVPFSFPVALKPADSVAWLDAKFEGKKKAFIFKDEQEFMTIVERIFASNYQGEMICQDFIPGDDSHMRVLNAYVDQHHKVRMMCLGNPLLEDPTPEAVGNYVAIMPDYNEKIYQNIQSFLEKIEYTGFANFDMKYDERDGEYKLFEINLRQGRSSYYVTLMGYNLAKYIVEDYVLKKELTEVEYAKGNKLWLGVPEKIVKKYVKDSDQKTKALEMMKNKQCGTTLFYKEDMNFKRYLLVNRIYRLYNKRYKEHFTEK